MFTYLLLILSQNKMNTKKLWMDTLSVRTTFNKHLERCICHICLFVFVSPQRNISINKITVVTSVTLIEKNKRSKARLLFRKNVFDKVMKVRLYRKDCGWSYSLHTQLTRFQIISKKKKIKSLRTRAVFSLSTQSKVPVQRWEGWSHYTAPLKSYF